MWCGGVEILVAKLFFELGLACSCFAYAKEPIFQSEPGSRFVVHRRCVAKYEPTHLGASDTSHD